TFSNAIGCDSILTTNLTVISNSTFSQNISICFGDSIFIGGSFQTLSGSYLDHYSSSLGCDSLVTTNLFVLPVSNVSVNVFICEGQSYYAGGANQTQSGLYIDSLVAITGCDSNVTTNLSVLLPTTTDVYPAICDGEQYFAGGTFQMTSGIYFDTL